MPLGVGSRIGVYEISSPLGAGAMGEVWRARDTRLSRDVALKVLPASFSSDHDRLVRFEREAQVLASLNHPNIAAIYGVEEAGGATALVLELVEGPTLDERIHHGRLPADEAVAIARQIAEALEFAHERGVVHRDLKPANVKLAPDGRVKVLDFGLAKAMAADLSTRSDSAISPTVTSLGTIAGVVLGTAAYMAPEQARGMQVDRRADIWSFGAVFWEMLTGKRAFEGETVSDTLASVLRAPIEWGELPTDTPPGVVRLLKRCLERDSKKRLRDIGEARIALENLGAEPEPAAAVAEPALPRRSALATIAWAVAAVATAIAAIAIVAVLKKPVPDRVVKFQVSGDPKLTTTTWPRISPDGRVLAFLGRDGAGKTSIWVRPLDAFSSHQLQDTEGASRFFWSPDSRFVAFFVNRSQLKKASVAGGPAQLITDAPGGADGTWGAAGEILFDGRATEAIRRVAASGGAVVPATTPDAAKGETGHAWPYFLPDGKHFLFLAMAKSVGEKAIIHVGLIDTPGSTAVGPSDSRVEYASGYLLYVLNGTLVARRFDPDKGEASGEPIPVAEHVSIDANNTASFSASDNGVLALLSGSGQAASQLMWLDRAGKELGTVGEPAAVGDVALAPDGKRVAYSVADRTGTQDIWVRDLNRDVASRLTFEPSDELWPVWSPDSRRIAHSSNADGGHFGVVIRDANGAGSPQTLTTPADGDLAPTDWSADGRLMALAFLPTSRRWDIKIATLGDPPKIANYLAGDATEFNGTFSPDGRFIAYQSNESGSSEIYVQTNPTGGGKWQISSGGGTQPRWRADGRELFFMAPDDSIRAVPVSSGASFEPGAPVVLFKRVWERATNVRSRWATLDGQRFLVNASLNSASAVPFSVIINWPATLAK